MNFAQRSQVGHWLAFFFFLNLYIFPIVKALFITVSVINKKQERTEEVISLNPRIH